MLQHRAIINTFTSEYQPCRISAVTRSGSPGRHVAASAYYQALRAWSCVLPTAQGARQKPGYEVVKMHRVNMPTLHDDSYYCHLLLIKLYELQNKNIFICHDAT